MSFSRFNPGCCCGCTFSRFNPPLEVYDGVADSLIVASVKAEKGLGFEGRDNTPTEVTWEVYSDKDYRALGSVPALRLTIEASGSLTVNGALLSGPSFTWQSPSGELSSVNNVPTSLTGLRYVVPYTEGSGDENETAGNRTGGAQWRTWEANDHEYQNVQENTIMYSWIPRVLSGGSFSPEAYLGDADNEALAYEPTQHYVGITLVNTGRGLLVLLPQDYTFNKDGRTYSTDVLEFSGTPVAEWYVESRQGSSWVQDADPSILTDTTSGSFATLSNIDYDTPVDGVVEDPCQTVCLTTDGMTPLRFDSIEITYSDSLGNDSNGKAIEMGDFDAMNHWSRHSVSDNRNLNNVGDIPITQPPTLDEKSNCLNHFCGWKRNPIPPSYSQVGVTVDEDWETTDIVTGGFGFTAPVNRQQRASYETSGDFQYTHSNFVQGYQSSVWVTEEDDVFYLNAEVYTIIRQPMLGWASTDGSDVVTANPSTFDWTGGVLGPNWPTQRPTSVNGTDYTLWWPLSPGVGASANFNEPCQQGHIVDKSSMVGELGDIGDTATTTRQSKFFWDSSLGAPRFRNDGTNDADYYDIHLCPAVDDWSYDYGVPEHPSSGVGYVDDASNTQCPTARSSEGFYMQTPAIVSRFKKEISELDITKGSDGRFLTDSVTFTDEDADPGLVDLIPTGRPDSNDPFANPFAESIPNWLANNRLPNPWPVEGEAEIERYIGRTGNGITIPYEDAYFFRLNVTVKTVSARTLISELTVRLNP